MRLPTLAHRELGCRAAHIKREDVALPRKSTEMRRHEGTCSRTGFKQQYRS